MPSLRAAVLAAIAGLGVGLYCALWFRWPTFIAVALGATMAIVMLLFAASLSDDPREADAAWRAAAPDLAERELTAAGTDLGAIQPSPPSAEPVAPPEVSP